MPEALRYIRYLPLRTRNYFRASTTPRPKDSDPVPIIGLETQTHEADRSQPRTHRQLLQKD